MNSEGSGAGILEMSLDNVAAVCVSVRGLSLLESTTYPPPLIFRKASTAEEGSPIYQYAGLRLCRLVAFQPKTSCLNSTSPMIFSLRGPRDDEPRFNHYRKNASEA